MTPLIGLFLWVAASWLLVLALGAVLSVRDSQVPRDPGDRDRWPS